MSKNLAMKIMAAVSGAAMLCTSASISSFAVSADSSSDGIVFKADFEDGDVSAFSKRGDTDTSVIAVAEEDGNKYMSVTGRTKSWNGPQICLNDYCEPGEQYIITADVKTAWYGTVTMSMQKNYSGGDAKYSNITSKVSQGSWESYDETTITMPADCESTYLYFECSDAGCDVNIDNVVIKKVPDVEIEDIAPLKDVFAKYFKLGTACTTDEISSKTNQKLVKKHFNSMTLGNELKPDAILDKDATIAAMNNGDKDNPQVNLASARPTLNFCRDNNIPVRGHVLVWHQQTPDWFFREDYDSSKDFVSKEEMLVRLENYIKNVFAAVEEEYPTVDFYAWDVVNECWTDDGKPRQGGANNGSQQTSPWVAIFGDNSFIKEAFKIAKKYAPEGCKLYYNDFNEYMPGKTKAMIEMAEDINSDGHYIDGLGLQSHLDARSGSDAFPSISAYEKALKQFCETGLDIQITELDATTSDTSEEGFKKQAEYYKGIMNLAVKYSDNISAVVFWGTVDSTSWRASKYPLLFDKNFQAKPAYYSIIEDIDYTPTEPTSEEKPTETEPTTESETTVDPYENYGDVNSDGVTNITDVVALQKYIIKDYDKKISSDSDVNRDGKVNVIDLALLKYFVANGAPENID